MTKVLRHSKLLGAAIFGADLSKDEHNNLNNILRGSDGLQKLIDAKTLKSIPKEHLMLWAWKHTLYTIVTIELISWLKEKIGDKKAIEIGSGSGIIGRELNIPRTDSYMNEFPKVKKSYELQRQPIISYPKEVEKLEALEAIRKYNPDIVIGSWISHLGTPYDPKSSPYGVDEEELLKSGCSYIMIGNENTHNKKKILTQKHEKLSPDWLFSRSFSSDANCIYFWENK